MALRVLGRKSSSNVQGVLWGLEELGLDYERVDYGGRYGGLNDIDFRENNPNGLVPVLEDGDLVLFESAAILRYLVKTYSDGPLRSDDPAADTWAEWGKHTFGRAFTAPIFWLAYRTPENQRDHAAISKNVRAFEEIAQIAMNKKGSAHFLMGNEITLADIWAGHVLYRYFDLDIDRNPPDGLREYYDRLTERRAYQKTIMVDYSELKDTLVG